MDVQPEHKRMGPGGDRHRPARRSRIDGTHAVSRALGDGLFEVRFALGSTARRITYRFTKDNGIILLTTFRKQRNNERAEITRARQIADECARLNP